MPPWPGATKAMGVSFIPARNMLKYDTVKYSAAVEMECPFTGNTWPCQPFIPTWQSSTHRADVYGNCQIEDHGLRFDLPAPRNV